MLAFFTNEFLYKLKILPLVALLAGCDTMDKIKHIGKEPDFHDMYQNIERKTEVASSSAGANSLWKPGSRSFFRDQRARAVGDILKVKVSIQDKAKLDNKTNTTYNTNSSMKVPNLLGLESTLGKILPSEVNPSALVGINSNDTGAGTGKIDRKETITTTIAAMVVKILPSNNLVIRGSQEIRVNYELREVTVEGIVRPEDISSDNSVALDQIAEARVSYGGRGSLSEVQKKRYGKEFLDIISPF